MNGLAGRRKKEPVDKVKAAAEKVKTTTLKLRISNSKDEDELMKKCEG